MQTSTTTVRSWGALAIGIFFAGVTGRTIFDDVLNGAPVTTAHLQSLAAIVGAIASGHMLLPVFKQAKIAAFLGMALIFAASTGYVVISAGARNAEVSAAKALTATSTNDDRHAAITKAEQAEAELADVKRDHSIAAAVAAKECKTGDGPVCKGKTKTADAAAVEVDKAKGFAILMRAKADVMKPVVEAHAGYAHAGKVLAALPYVTASAESIQTSVELLLPFAVVLIAEVGCLTFLGLGLGHREAPAPAKVPANDTAPAAAPRKPVTPRPRGKRGPKKDDKVIAFVGEFRKRHGRNPTIPEMQASLDGIARSTAHRYATAA